MHSEPLFTEDDLAHAAEAVARVHALPGVPTTDWCERAVNALGALPRRPATTVAIFAIGDDQSVRVDPTHLDSSANHLGRSVAFGRPGAAGLAERLQAVIEPQWPTPRSGVYGPFDGPGRLGRVDAAGARLYGIVGVDDTAPPTAGPWLAVELRLDAAVGDFRAPDALAAALRVVLAHLAPRYRLAFGDSATHAIGRVTPSEQIVLEQLVMGRSVKEIADELSRSPHTIHDHIKSLHRKFGASNRGQLVARALGHVVLDEG